MKVWDMHCDTLAELRYAQQELERADLGDGRQPVGEQKHADQHDGQNRDAGAGSKYGLHNAFPQMSGLHFPIHSFYQIKATPHNSRLTA